LVLAGVAVSSASSPATAATAPEIAIGSVVVNEGDVGVRPAHLVVTLSSPAAVDAHITYIVLAGSATTPSDYVRRSGRVRIRAGKTFAAITSKIVPDLLAEGDETFSVVLTSSDVASIAQATGTVTIRDDDPQSAGRLAIGDTSVHEGDAAQNPLRFTVSLDAPLLTDVTARYTSVGGSAIAGGDFASRSRPLRIRAGRTAIVLAFKTIGDTSVEGSEQFTVVLSSVVGATTTDATGVGVVLDDDPPLTTVPDAPTLTGAVAGPTNGMLAVNWGAPASDGGSAVTGYELEITRPSDTVVGSYTGLGANVVCGSPGVTCGLRVRALNLIGAGAWSEPLEGTTWRAPSAVADLTVSRGNVSVSAFWTVPSSAGDFPILDYRVERSTDGTTFTFVEFSDHRSTTVSCPGEQITCWIRVRARNAAGLGPATEGSAMTWGRPTAPTLVSIRRIGTSVGLGWTPPSDDGGAAVVDYTAERTIDSGTTWTPVGTVQFTLPTCPAGVSCGFRVTAHNLVGASPPSNVLTVGP
jgi:hypothetical protein